MNQDINPLDLVARDLSQSTNPVILLPNNPSMDCVFASLALQVGLIKLGKNPSIACSTKINFAIKDVDKIRTELASNGNNLVISFPYVDGSIDKVDYKIENSTFNLIVIPREGFAKITPEQVRYSYIGGQNDYIITLDAMDIQSLGKIYSDNQQALDQLPLGVIDRHVDNTLYGSVNLVQPNIASISQLVFELLRVLEIAIDEVIATNILNGIIAATNNLTSPNTNAEVYMQIGELMKLGAIREQVNQSPRQPQPMPNRPMGQASSNRPSRPPMAPRNDVQSNQNINQQTRTANPNRQTQSQPNEFQNPQQPTVDQRVQPSSWIDNIPTDQQVNSNQPNTMDNIDKALDNDASKNAPQDWLKPKIFKGNGFV